MDGLRIIPLRMGGGKQLVGGKGSCRYVKVLGWGSWIERLGKVSRFSWPTLIGVLGEHHSAADCSLVVK